MLYSVPAVRGVQNGQEVFLFLLPAKTLNALPIKVEQFDPDKPYDDSAQGYQRAAEKNRARRFARYLESPDAISPTALMLNDRNRVSKFDAAKGVLTFDSDKGPIFNYDGQHRELGYRFRLENDPGFSEFPIPVVMTRGMDKLAEMLQFRTINSTAKGVATALVNAILAKLHATEGDQALDGDVGMQRNVVSYKATELLNNDPDGPWYHLIALPNQSQWTKRDIREDPAREHTRVIKANSFVDGLRPIYDYVSTLSLAAGIDEKAENIARIVGEFWSALKEMMPEAFDAASDYALFHSGGVGPIHLVLRDLLVKMHVGRRDFVKAEFMVMLEGSDLLNTAEFWRSDNEDGARIYSGKANWPDLARRIIRDVDEGARAGA